MLWDAAYAGPDEECWENYNVDEKVYRELLVLLAPNPFGNSFADVVTLVFVRVH